MADKARVAQVRQQLRLRVVVFGLIFLVAFGTGGVFFLIASRGTPATFTLVLVGIFWLVMAVLAWLGPLRNGFKALADIRSLNAKDAPGALTTGVVMAKFENDSTLLGGPFQFLVRPQTQAMIITEEGEAIIPQAELPAPDGRVEQIIERVEDLFSEREHQRTGNAKAQLDHSNISKPRRALPHEGQPFVYQAPPKIVEPLLRPIRFDVPGEAFQSINRGDFVRIAHLPRTRLVTGVELVHRGLR